MALAVLQLFHSISVVKNKVTLCYAHVCYGREIKSILVKSDSIFFLFLTVMEGLLQKVDGCLLTWVAALIFGSFCTVFATSKYFSFVSHV